MAKAILDFEPKNVPKDIGAGLTLAMVAIPDSIASAILAGVNPIFAFNSMMVGMPVAGTTRGPRRA
jgi:MFS superfamily sulfate permease-like transporter